MSVRTFGQGALKVVRGLIAEKKDGEWEMSKGGVGFWLVLGHLMYAFATERPVGDMEVYVLFGLMGYNSLKHIRDGFAARKANVI